MNELQLARDGIKVGISPAGGALRYFRLSREGDRVDVVRPYSGPDRPFDVLKSGGFPLIPFGNRVQSNCFRFDRHEYRFLPNQKWDSLYLHGDAWLSQWSVESHSQDSAVIKVRHDAEEGAPYTYEATERFDLRDNGLLVTMSVRNDGPRAMPFGLGFHPFFSMNEHTLLMAHAGSFWEEGEGYMPSRETDLPQGLDFSSPRGLPRKWTNNQFEDWDGNAVIIWPDRKLQLEIHTDPAYKWYFVFVSSVEFDPGYRHDFFCFEPMSHPVDDHHNSPFRGLEILQPGGLLTGSLRFTLRSLP